MGEPVDRDKKTAQERFAEIRKFFLAWLEDSGHARTELYYRPKPGDSREPTEEEIVRRWAADLRIPLNDILIGVQRAFEGAAERGAVVTSFRYCVPQIVSRIQEMRGSRVGSQ
ncbi:MAG TPA: hypothetical protein VKQ28_14650 [Candidatus Acidoferrum sp.]|nr:hypothetical protein [Candidatus Acidoferrum sp.]